MLPPSESFFTAVRLLWKTEDIPLTLPYPDGVSEGQFAHVLDQGMLCFLVVGRV